MANVMPDDILENIVCSCCKKYLSVKPIKIYPNRQIKCGRCVEEGDNGVESLYGLFAEEVLFPCVNRYEDCHQLLKYSEVKSHEQTCCVRSYHCVICNNFNGSAYELLTHFKICHKNNVIYYAEFPIDFKFESMEQYYLYHQRNFLFMISVKCDTMSEELLLNMTLIGPEQKGNYLKYQFILYDLKRDFKYTATKKIQGCSSFGTITNYQIIKFSELGTIDKVFICNIQINTSECEGLFHISQTKNAQKSDQLKNRQTSLRSPVVSDKCSLIKPLKIIQPGSSVCTNQIDLNEEVSIFEILDSKVRPIIKRKLSVNVTNTKNLPKHKSIEIIVSDDQTSIIFIHDDKRIEFEMICFGCKQNLPTILIELNRDGTYSRPLKISQTVYGCTCLNNIVCENCYSDWNFKTCKNGHQYTNKIIQSTLLATLNYDDWKPKGICKVLSLESELNDSTVSIYCRCQGGPLNRTILYLDFIIALLSLNLSLLDTGLFTYHAQNCRYINHAQPLQFLWPFVSHSIYLNHLLDQTLVAVVNTLILVEKFRNDVTTSFKLRFFNQVQKKILEKTIVSIVKFNFGYKIFKGDFLIWNTDITTEAKITFRII